MSLTFGVEMMVNRRMVCSPLQVIKQRRIEMRS
jgi:hypothetical protein